ncbi:MAG: 2,3-bisphosphoglycerate-independent phosphoglycerate mutase [candidate division Zixibacteria bacterium]|nr:2,3-bisphosphoglycerate-independent phosphoglycerate mutase [candidate division Zixibacteria bacterium]
MSVSPVVLVILDGWGLSPRREANAVALARTPCFDRLCHTYPHTQLVASGEDVGLPPGIMGNSEVGHLNLGAGRIVEQEVSRIDRAIADGSFFDNPVLTEIFERVRVSGGCVHLMGLVSDGLVHSAEKHYMALLDMARRMNFPGDRVMIHAILDGRDVPPKSAPEYIAALRHKIEEGRVGRIVTVSGRYYAMDRDNRWERVRKAYDAFVSGEGERADSPEEAIRNAYTRGETDEFVLPTVVMDRHQPEGRLRDGEGVILFNYRTDRGREILRALTDPAFTGFERSVFPQLTVATMTQYDASLPVPYAFRPQTVMRDILGETLAEHGKKQFRTAETEKYPHVTYFFNGGNETPFAGEDRVMVPSPRWVATYDAWPEMSTPGVAWKVVRALESGQYDFILVNFANPDMVGHTGSLPAAICAVESVDWALSHVIEVVASTGGRAIVTADHGNAETMVDPETGRPHTAHTTNPVPFILADDTYRNARLRNDGRLADVAPTVLALLGIGRPDDMTGRNLIENG